MTKIIPGLAAAGVLLALSLPVTAAERAAEGARPAPAAISAAAARPRILRTRHAVQRRVFVSQRYTTRRYWRYTRGPYWGPHYQPWPSYGVYPWLYRPYYGWGPPMRGFAGGMTW